ncbi:FxLD family lanthipeptide [Streptomyces sp. NPDC016845]|uniref:FxLD family lanthipeptide n=1 Tax=Streptomyces sp. NPDC016845 TaxID=3364972 RepID=UPI0037A80F9B
MNNQSAGTTADVAVTDVVDLDLNVKIVTFGPVAAALLSSTDDGCDTQKNGDC